MREKLREILTNEDKVIIWDVDGVLAAYEYGERNHNACLDLEWDEYLKEHDFLEKGAIVICEWLNTQVQSVCLSVQPPQIWKNLKGKQLSLSEIIQFRKSLSLW